MIPYGRQSIDDSDIDAVTAVLRSPWLTQGPIVPQFEQAIASQCRVKHAVATSNATAALHIACLTLDIGPGDTVWTSPITFVASANCARYCGANVDFVDIDPDTQNMCTQALAEKLEIAQKTGRIPKAIIPVHFSGRSCDMRELADLVRPHGIRIIEDASHAIGATYLGKPIGCCDYSDICIFSFHPVKIITTGEGGILVTNDKQIAGRATRLRSHGITREPADFHEAPAGPWYYEQIELGFNYRLTDLQAALGLSQLGRLEQFIERRRNIASRYQQHLQSLDIGLPPFSDESAWHLYPIRIRHNRRAFIFSELRNRGISPQIHYIPVHLQPYYRNLGFGINDYPAAEAYYQQALSLPIFPELSDAEQDQAIHSLRTAISLP